MWVGPRGFGLLANRPEFNLADAAAFHLGMLKMMSVLPDRARHWVGRAAHADTAFTKVDPAARADYHRRIVGD